MALGLVPIMLHGSHLFQPGYPYIGDGTSLLLPALHARDSILHGHLPIYTDLWYGGRYQFMNPLWKGFYPPWWLLFIPGIPILLAQKVLVAVHFIATTSIAYYYARQDFEWWVAVPLALLFVFPMAVFKGHMWKTFSWPWVTLLMWQLTKSRITRPTQRHGMIAGICLGTMLLTGGSYYFFYFAGLVAALVVALRQRVFVVGVMKGSLVGLPKIIFSFIPVMILGGERPSLGKSLSPSQLITGLTGFWIDASEWTIELENHMFFEGYAVIGLPACLLAACAFLYAYRHPQRERSRWFLGVMGAALFGVLLATGWSILYQLPGVEKFRAGARANSLVAITLLLAVWFTLRIVTRQRRTIVTAAVTGLLVLSVINGTIAWGLAYDTHSVQSTAGDRVTDSVVSAGCDRVWMEGRGGLENKQLPYKSSISFELTQRGIPLQAVYYAPFGQKYGTHQNGTQTFDALLIGSPLPENGSVALEGGQTGHGTINVSRFALRDTISTDKGPVYLYTVNGSCEP